MADINKIFTEYMLNVSTTKFNSIGFVDGLATSKTLYGIVDNEISLQTEVNQYLSVFYNYNTTKTFEYDVILRDYGVEISGMDRFGNELILPKANKLKKVLVFLNGSLLNNSKYTFLDDISGIVLNFSIPNNEYQRIIIYTITNTDEFIIENISNPLEKINKNYSEQDTMIFCNGELLPAAYVLKDSQGFTLHYDYKKTDVITYIKLPKGTMSNNFIGEKGYLNYGPIDNFQRTVQNIYDCVITFNELSYLVIDNLRTGFFVKEQNGPGELMITDDNFGTNSLKCIIITPFKNSTYKSNEWYVEVPTTKSILDYLPDFDKKYKLLPEVLKVFQRIMLDELQDEVQRLRDARSLSKVDSKNINNLIKMLGFDVDIKYLTTKQKHEILDELNEFYRILGTKKSYNFFNIMQDTTRIINIEPLFTPRGYDIIKKNTVYAYNINIKDAGQNYYIGERLIIKNPRVNFDKPLFVTVSDVDDSGKIKGITYEENINGLQDLPNISGYELKTPGEGAYANCTSEAYEWKWKWDVANAGNYYVSGQKLVSTKENKSGVGDNTFNFSMKCNVDGANNGKVTSVKNITPDRSLGSNFINKNTIVPFTVDTDVLNIKIDYVPTSIGLKTIYNSTTTDKNLNIDVPANTKYRLIMRGGGGAGGSKGADAISGKASRIGGNGGAGGKGLLTINTITVNSNTNIVTTVGVGGATFANGGNGGQGNLMEFAGGNGGGGGKPSFAKFGNTYYYALGGGGGGGGGAAGMAWRYRNAGSGGGGGGYYRFSNGSVISVAGQTGARNGGNDDGSGSSGINGNVVDFPNLTSGGGGRGGYWKGPRGWGGNGASGGGASGAGGGAGAGNHDSSNSGGGGGGAGGDNNAGGGAGGPGYNNGANASNHYTTSVDISSENAQYGIGANYGRGGNMNQNGNNGFVLLQQYLYSYNVTVVGNNYTKVLAGEYYKSSDGKFIIKIDKVNNNGTIDISLVSFPENTSTASSSIELKFYNMANGLQLTPTTLKDQITLYKNKISFSNESQTSYVVGDKLQFQNLDKNPLPGEETFYFTVRETNNGKLLGNNIRPYYNQLDDANVDHSKYINNYISARGYNFKDSEVVPNPNYMGSGASVYIESRDEITDNIEREYVDFYNKEQLGAIYHKEYKLDVVDYGYVTEGSPKSPYPWAVGEPDEDYGYTTEDDNAKYNDYGQVNDKIKGQWVDWWEWERPKNYYPTNHVEIEITILSYENYNETLLRFYKQFYKIASAVLYIHSLVTSFIIGNTNSKQSIDDNNKICFGIMTGQPVTYERYTITSDPARQLQK